MIATLPTILLNSSTESAQQEIAARLSAFDEAAALLPHIVSLYLSELRATGVPPREQIERMRNAIEEVVALKFPLLEPTTIVYPTVYGQYRDEVFKLNDIKCHGTERFAMLSTTRSTVAARLEFKPLEAGSRHFNRLVPVEHVTAIWTVQGYAEWWQGTSKHEALLLAESTNAYLLLDPDVGSISVAMKSEIETASYRRARFADYQAR